MKRRMLLALSAGALAIGTTVTVGAVSITAASASGGSQSCTLKGTATFKPPLGLTTQSTKVTFKGTLSNCTGGSYGITGGTVKNSGTGPATCNPNSSNSLTTTGKITWKGGKGTNTDTSTSTGVANSNPPEDTLSGEITGGTPVPAGTATSGSITYNATSKVKSECAAGKLKKITFSGTTSLG